VRMTRRAFLGGSAGVLALAACGTNSDTDAAVLNISAIPDQDQEKLNRLYGAVADRFAAATGLEVRYRTVVDYQAVVRAFEVGDVQVAWMGGFTGVQARNRVEGATAIAQRDIDADFHSVFIATRASGLRPFGDIAGLRQLAGHTFTFGSETSTSGRLMPQYFMDKGGLAVSELRGKPGFSGSHDATIEAVASRSFDAGVVNEQVWESWKAGVAAGKPNVGDVVVLWRTPGYADYHWLARPDLDSVAGPGTTQAITDLLFGLDAANPQDAEILELFGATRFIATKNSNYDQIEAVAREQGLLE
jgi:phosphonate transport system substrate-binding protein